MLPSNLAKRIDVADFATPVQAIETRGQSGGTRLTISTNGAFDSMAYQTGNEYVVEVAPKKGLARATSGASTIGGINATPVYHGKPATFNFQDVPVRTVLQLIAEESGLNVVASDTVQGNVTLRLINVPWDQALDIVLRAKGLDKRKDGDVIWIAPQKEISDYEQAREDARIAIDLRAETVNEYIPINYGNAEDIAKLLTDEAKTGTGAGGGGAGAGAGGNQQQRGFLSPRGSVSFDRRTNTLLVSDLPKKVAEIRALVKLLDRPVDQVLIEGRIVIATEDFARDLGARFGILGQKGNVVTSGTLESNNNYINGVNANNEALQAYQNALAACPAPCTTPPTAPTLKTPAFLFPGLLNVNLPVNPNAGSLALSILNHGLSLDMELTALQTEGRGEVISNPRVITSNQKEAIIRQGDQIGYSTTTTTNGVSQSTVAFKDAVLELKVTPTITNDGRVFMALDVKKDELAKFIHTSNGDVPQITTREVTTAVLVESGQTVVIGGVYEFHRREDLSKVPFLGDLPLLGNLFKQTARSNTKAELLIFITPKILQFSQRN
jgi:type IV pilus assembly protein PilQ